MDNQTRALMQQYDPQDWIDFAFFSANVQHILDVHDLDRQAALYAEAKRFASEQASLDMEGIRRDTGPSSPLHDLPPGFIVSFHFGYYRLLPARLLSQGLSLAVLVSADVVEQEKAYYRCLIGDRWGDRLQFLPVEEDGLFFRIKALIDKGYHVFCFVDGGKGTRPMSDNECTGISEVALLSSLIRVRNGYAQMAYVLGCPVYQPYGHSLCAVQIQQEEIRTFDPKDYDSRASFVQESVSKIFHYFGTQLHKDPMAWEGWFYIHRYMKPRSIHQNWPLKTRYIPFKHHDKAFLLNKLDFQSYAINAW